MLKKKMIAILAALLLPSCATTSMQSLSDHPADRVNATADTSAVAVSSGEKPLMMPLLAIEVEITADGVKPLGASIVLAPRKANSAIEDLRVQAGGVDGWSYTMPDPRLATSSDPGQPEEIVLESVRTFVYVPLLAAVKTLSIESLAPPDRVVSRGGKFDVRALAREVCTRTRSPLPVCREILGE